MQTAFTKFYFFYCSLFTLHTIFLPIICNSLGFSAAQISYISVAGTAMGIVAPLILQYLAQHHLSERNAVITCLALMLLLFAALSQARLFISFLIIWALYQLCSRLGVYIDAMAIELTAKGKMKFEHARVWGSVSFIIVSILIGTLLDYFSTIIIFYVCGAIILGLGLVTQRLLPLLPKQPRSHSGPQIKLKLTTVLTITPLLLVVFLNTLAHAPLFLYWPLYLQELGCTKTMVSVGWSVSIVCEIVFFLIAPRLISKPAHLAVLILLSTLFGTIRWSVVYSTENLFFLIASQALHAFTFAGVYIGSNRLIYYLLPEQQKHLGQGFLQAIGAGLGLAVGQLLFGQLFDESQGYDSVGHLFGVSALACAAAFTVSILLFQQVWRLHTRATIELSK